MKRLSFHIWTPTGKTFLAYFDFRIHEKGAGLGNKHMDTGIGYSALVSVGFCVCMYGRRRSKTKNKKIHKNVYSKTVQKYLIWRLDVTLDGMISKITITFHEALLLLKYTKKKKKHVHKKIITKGEMCYFQKTGHGKNNI